MKINNLMSLALILSGLTIVNSSHAMLMQRAMNRSGTKYVAQVAQTAQKRWMETESKNSSHTFPDVLQKTFEGRILCGAMGAAFGSGVAMAIPFAIGGSGAIIVSPFGKEAMEGTFEVWRFFGMPIGIIAGFPASAVGGPIGVVGYSSLLAAYAHHQWKKEK